MLVRSTEALVGIPLSQPLGMAEITYKVGEQIRSHSFKVNDKAYTEQHITLKNREMVNPKLRPAGTYQAREQSAARLVLGVF